MVRNTKLQLLRDIIELLFTILTMMNSYGLWVTEQSHYILFGAATIICGLVVLNLILLLIVKVQGIGYYKLDCILQILVSLGVFLMLFYLPFLLIFILNLLVMFTLKEKKS